MPLSLALLPLFLAAMACSPSKPEVHTPLDLKSRYIKATVELICVGLRTPSPQDVVKHTQSIYQKYGFVAPMEYLELVHTYENDGEIQASILQGGNTCKRP